MTPLIDLVAPPVVKAETTEHLGPDTGVYISHLKRVGLETFYPSVVCLLLLDIGLGVEGGYTYGLLTPIGDVHYREGYRISRRAQGMGWGWGGVGWSGTAETRFSHFIKFGGSPKTPPSYPRVF